jgi:serine/threonine-protein kinase
VPGATGARSPLPVRPVELTGRFDRPAWIAATAHARRRGAGIARRSGTVSNPHERMLDIGAVVGDYRIEGLVGQGGMGQVYGAVHPVIGKRAAVKVLRRELCTDPEVIERFVLEARAVNQIGHPNIVDVFAFGALPDGRHYMVMEWLRGESLSSRLERSPPPLDEACELLVGVCAARGAAHASHIVHRDLKPHNVFLVDVRAARPMVKLLDFGLVKLMGNDDVRMERTRSGSLLGTPAYMSPEQARGRGVDHRTDLYALGVMLFEMATGRLPFLEPSAMEIVVAHLQQPVPIASEYRRGIPPELDALIAALMAKDPAHRPGLPVVVDQLREIQRIAQGASAATMNMPAPLVPRPSFAPPLPAADAVSTLGHATGEHAKRTELVGASPPRRKVLAVFGTAALLVGALTFVGVSRARRRGGAEDPPPAAAAGAPATVPAPPPVVDAAPAAEPTPPPVPAPPVVEVAPAPPPVVDAAPVKTGKRKGGGKATPPATIAAPPPVTPPPTSTTPPVATPPVATPPKPPAQADDDGDGLLPTRKANP